MTKLVFDVAAVRQLYEHAKASREHTPTFEMLFEKKYLKDGLKEFANGEYAGPEEYDPAKVPAHLKLVKDDGAYLLSSGIPHLPGEQKHHKVAYAAGFGPDADHERVVGALGGDDFVQSIPLEWLDRAFADEAVKLWLTISRTKLGIGWEAGEAAKAKNPPRTRPAYDKQQLARVNRTSGGRVRPKWASCGGTYKGTIVEVAETVLYQCVGNGARRGIVVHERALVPKEFHIPGLTVAIKYPEDQNAPATVSRA